MITIGSDVPRMSNCEFQNEFLNLFLNESCARRFKHSSHSRRHTYKILPFILKSCLEFSVTWTVSSYITIYDTTMVNKQLNYGKHSKLQKLHSIWNVWLKFTLYIKDLIINNQWFDSEPCFTAHCQTHYGLQNHWEWWLQSWNSVQFSSVTQSCPTGLPVHHQLLESTQTHVHWVSDAIQRSHPLSSPSPPALNLSQHQGLF